MMQITIILRCTRCVARVQISRKMAKRIMTTNKIINAKNRLWRE